ncbi:hypothetical protein C4E44_08095 [Pseudomonas sp. MWU12-2312b]|nr:hypothetical protein C4E44_08095 [Pseudomonas sp. MWU12-2312b]
METSAVVYDFRPSHAGEHARSVLQDWKGKLVCDDFGGYKASFVLGVTEIDVRNLERSARPGAEFTVPGTPYRRCGGNRLSSSDETPVTMIRRGPK